MKSVFVLAMASALVLLAGCTSSFAPDPVQSGTPSTTPTAATAQCSPRTAGFGWGTRQDSGFAAVSTHTQTYGATESGTASDDSSPDLTVTSLETSGIIDAITAHPETWDPVMLASLQAAGRAPDLFGSMYSAVDTTPFVPPEPHTGTYVRVVVAQTWAFDFGVKCADGSTASGTLTGAVPADIAEFTIHCDDRSHPKDSPQKAVARAACPKA